MASERLTPRCCSMTTAWSSATASITAVPISVSETIACATPSTMAAISRTPKQTVSHGLQRHLRGAKFWARFGQGSPLFVGHSGRRFTEAVVHRAPPGRAPARRGTEARSSAPATSGSRALFRRASFDSAQSERALEMNPRLVEALELDVGTADQEVREPQPRIVAQAPLEQGDRLVEPAVSSGDGGEPRDRQGEGAVLQRRLFVIVGGLGGAAGGLGQRAEPLLGRAESGGDRARPLEGRRCPGLVAAAEESHAAQVGRLTGEGIALPRPVPARPARPRRRSPSSRSAAAAGGSRGRGARPPRTPAGPGASAPLAGLAGGPLLPAVDRAADRPSRRRAPGNASRGRRAQPRAAWSARAVERPPARPLRRGGSPSARRPTGKIPAGARRAAAPAARRPCGPRGPGSPRAAPLRPALVRARSRARRCPETGSRSARGARPRGRARDRRRRPARRAPRTR